MKRRRLSMVSGCPASPSADHADRRAPPAGGAHTQLPRDISRVPLARSTRRRRSRQTPDNSVVAAGPRADLGQRQRGLDEVTPSVADTTPDSSDHSGAVTPASLSPSFHRADGSISVIEGSRHGGLVAEVADRLAAHLPGARWKFEFVIDRLVEPPTDLAEVISAGRRMLLDRGWHLVVCVTDLPLQTARPVIADVSADSA